MSRSIATALLILLAVSLLHPDVAQGETMCYWQSPTGQTIDLSSICGPVQTKGNAAVSLQSLLKAYPKAIQQEINQYVQHNPNGFAAQTATTCRTRRYGGQSAEVTRRQALIAYQGGGEAIQARQAVVDAYAIANDCPELAK